MDTKFIVLCAIFLATSCNSARILGISPSPSYSHQIVFQPIWRELASRGHELVVITTDPINDPTLTNLKEIDLSFSYKEKEALFSKEALKDSMAGFKMMQVFVNFTVEMTAKQLEHPEVQNLIHSETERFDLVIFEYISPIFGAFVHKFNCPSIGVQSLEISADVRTMLGNPQHPATSPMMLLPSYRDLSFSERLGNFLWLNAMPALQRFMFKDQLDSVVYKYFGKEYPGQEEILKNVDLLFSNVNPVFKIPNPTVANIIEFGGGVHIKAPKPLPSDIEKFLNESTTGVVYFSLGSNVRVDFIEKGLKDAMFDALAAIPYDVLMKFDDDSFADNPKIKIIKWGPQQDILRHPNVKAFVSQCGLQSMEEALYSHVPVVGLPFFGDQPQNGKMVEFLGLGKTFNIYALSATEFADGIVEVVSNPKYKSRMVELAKLSKDQPMTGMQKVGWWTDYVIRNNGAKHLRSLLADLPWYQYYMLDVLGLLLFVICSGLFVVFKVVKLLCFCCRTPRGKKMKTQ